DYPYPPGADRDDVEVEDPEQGVEQQRQDKSKPGERQRLLKAMLGEAGLEIIREPEAADHREHGGPHARRLRHLPPPGGPAPPPPRAPRARRRRRPATPPAPAADPPARAPRTGLALRSATSPATRHGSVMG